MKLLCKPRLTKFSARDGITHKLQANDISSPHGGKYEA
jgi:hypothetical protein